MNSVSASKDTLKSLLPAMTEEYPERDMFLFWNRERSCQKHVRFSEFLRQTECVGAGLLHKGYERRHIAIISENSFEWFLAFYAITASGNTAVLINHAQSAESVKRLLRFNDVSAAYVSDGYADVAEELRREGGIDIFDSRALHELGEDVSDEMLSFFRQYPVHRSDRALIAFTSGTTGEQKGVMLSHWNIVSDIIACAKALPGGNKMLSALPLFHMFGLTASIGFTLRGTTLVISESLRYFVKDIIREGPDYILAVPALLPTLYSLYFQMPPKEEVCIICGGAAADPAWVEKLARLNIFACMGYGMTECSPVIAMSEERERFDGYMRIHSIFEMKLDQPDENGIGEILIRGDGVTSGYYHMEKETAEILCDGWLHTGDLGKMKDKDHVTVVGRKKNLLVLANGVNISPEVIEQKLLSLPGVKECLVSVSAAGLLQAEIYAPDSHEDGIREQINEYNHICPSSERIMVVLFRQEEFIKSATGKIARGLS